MVKNSKIENGKPRPSNILLESMHRGFEPIIDYLFNEGFSNIRAILKKKNHLEIEPEDSEFEISFFLVHME